MNRLALATLVAILGVAFPCTAAEKRAISFDLRTFCLGPNLVIDPQDDSMRLAHSILLANESGATDFRQTEVLSDKVWARTSFIVDPKPGDDGELLVFGRVPQIVVNGTALKHIEPLASTGWT